MNRLMSSNLALQMDVVERLVSIIPAFKAEWAARCDGEEIPWSTPHAAYIVFLPVLKRTELTERQANAFACLANGAVAQGGAAENAISTCILEHLRGSQVLKALKPHLSDEARRRLSPYFVPNDPP